MNECADCGVNDQPLFILDDGDGASEFLCARCLMERFEKMSRCARDVRP